HRNTEMTIKREYKVDTNIETWVWIGKTFYRDKMKNIKYSQVKDSFRYLQEKDVKDIFYEYKFVN
ncbi:hypothetical protein HHI36_013432, partial [Cryptolaemus montrouzieri]